MKGCKSNSLWLQAQFLFVFFCFCFFSVYHIVSWFVSRILCFPYSEDWSKFLVRFWTFFPLNLCNLQIERSFVCVCVCARAHACVFMFLSSCQSVEIHFEFSVLITFKFPFPLKCFIWLVHDAELLAEFRKQKDY